MTPERHKELAEEAIKNESPMTANYHASMGILEALLQMEICGHGTRGFCIDCITKVLNDKTIVRTRDWRD